MLQIGAALIFLLALAFVNNVFSLQTLAVRMLGMKGGEGVQGAEVASFFRDSFEREEYIEESDTLDHSASPHWWINSGGVLQIKNGTAQSIQDLLPQSNGWRRAYALSNPTDTDNGYRPQNVLRIITRNEWQDSRAEVYVKIRRENLTRSPNRNESNGIFLLNRYYDSDNTYYAGIRVDGSAVIKKKARGIYYELGYEPGVVAQGERYHKTDNPNLIPKNNWIGLRMEVVNRGAHEVGIAFYIDLQREGVWKEIVRVADDGTQGGRALREQGHAGIRTDFLDVEFDEYLIEKI